MYGRHAARQILPPLSTHDEPSVDNHVPKLLLTREPLDALHQVLVAIPIPRDELPNKRDGPKAPLLVHGIEQRVLVDLTKLQHGQHAAGLEHAVRLAQGFGDVAKVADAKSDGVQVDRVGGDAAWTSEVLGVGLEEAQCGLLGGGEGEACALLADGEHGWVDVGDGHAYVGVGVDGVGVGEVAEGDVAGAAGDVEDVLRGGFGGGCGARVEAWVEGGDVVVSVKRLVVSHSVQSA